MSSAAPTADHAVPFADKAPMSIAIGRVLLGIALLVIWRHRDNVLRLVRGTEPRLGEKKT